MSNISSNSLFHFTPQYSYLINILQKGFLPRYCYEELLMNETRPIKGHSVSIPMVCFCDIPLGQINHHISMYGSYGLGMKKEWGIKNKLNPVIYLNKDSNIATPISKIAEISLLKLNNSEDPDIKKTASELLNIWTSISFYSKPYSGSIKHKGKNFKNIKFYDEREWRYLPIVNGKLASGVLNKELMENPKELELANKKNEKYKLDFDVDDIKYIFIKNETERYQMVETLRKMHNSKYNNKAIDILISKILTSDQIQNDF